MASHTRHTVAYRRKREGRTNYKKRLATLVSQKIRFVVRKSNSNILVQLIEYNPDGDKVIISVSSTILAKKYGYNLHRGNIPSAYLTGLIAGKMALEKGIKEAILDIGLQTSVKGSRIYAALRGAVEAGLQIPHDEEIIPPDDSVMGKIISQYASKVEKEDKEKYNKLFSLYLKNGVNPKDIPKIVEETKQKIMKG